MYNSNVSAHEGYHITPQSASENACKERGDCLRKRTPQVKVHLRYRRITPMNRNRFTMKAIPNLVNDK